MHVAISWSGYPRIADHYGFSSRPPRLGEMLRRRRQPAGQHEPAETLADPAHLLGLAGVDEQHVGAGLVEGFGAA